MGKTCTKCGITKASAEFRMRTDRPGKRRAECLECQSGQQYLTQKKYPKKMRARSIAAQAKKKGELVSPECCEKCSENKKLIMHHDDYDKPLEVDWFCVKCHRKHHKELRQAS